MTTEQDLIQVSEEILNPELVNEVKIFLNHFKLISPAIEKAAQITGIKSEVVSNIFDSINKITSLL
jgi:hypothetical protein